MKFAYSIRLVVTVACLIQCLAMESHINATQQSFQDLGSQKLRKQKRLELKLHTESIDRLCHLESSQKLKLEVAADKLVWTFMDQINRPEAHKVNGKETGNHRSFLGHEQSADDLSLTTHPNWRSTILQVLDQVQLEQLKASEKDREIRKHRANVDFSANRISEMLFMDPTQTDKFSSLCQSEIVDRISKRTWTTNIDLSDVRIIFSAIRIEKVVDLLTETQMEKWRSHAPSELA